MDTMFFNWLPKPVDIDANLEIAQFTLIDTVLYDCSQNYTAGMCVMYVCQVCVSCMCVRYVCQVCVS